MALAGSIRSCYNTPEVNYDSWKPNAMLCSGTTIGTRRGIERYLRTPVGARGHYVCFVPFSTRHYTLVRFSTLSYTLVRFRTLSYAKPIRFVRSDRTNALCAVRLLKARPSVSCC